MQFPHNKCPPARFFFQKTAMRAVSKSIVCPALVWQRPSSACVAQPSKYWQHARRMMKSTSTSESASLCSLAQRRWTTSQHQILSIVAAVGGGTLAWSYISSRTQRVHAETSEDTQHDNNRPPFQFVSTKDFKSLHHHITQLQIISGIQFTATQLALGIETPDEFVELGGMELLAKVLANYHSMTDKEEQHRLLGHSLVCIASVASAGAPYAKQIVSCGILDKLKEFLSLYLNEPSIRDSSGKDIQVLILLSHALRNIAMSQAEEIIKANIYSDVLSLIEKQDPSVTPGNHGWRLFLQGVMAFISNMTATSENGRLALTPTLRRQLVRFMCFPDHQTSRFAAEAVQNYYASIYEASSVALVKEVELLDTVKQLVTAMRYFNLHRDLSAIECAARTLYYITATDKGAMLVSSFVADSHRQNAFENGQKFSWLLEDALTTLATGPSVEVQEIGLFIVSSLVDKKTQKEHEYTAQMIMRVLCLLTESRFARIRVDAQGIKLKL